jgi:hypothetical protein
MIEIQRYVFGVSTKIDKRGHPFTLHLPDFQPFRTTLQPEQFSPAGRNSGMGIEDQGTLTQK